MKSIIILSTLIFFISCSNEKSESKKKQEELIKKEEELIKQQYVDSIRKSVIDGERKKSELTNQMNELMSQIEGKLNRINYYEVEVQTQEEKYEYLRTPKFLRTPEEREQQLRNQLYLLNELKSQLNNEMEEFENLIEKINKIRVKLGLQKLRENDVKTFLTTDILPADSDSTALFEK